MKLLLIFFIITNLFSEDDFTRIPKESETEKKESVKKTFEFRIRKNYSRINPFKFIFLKILLDQILALDLKHQNF